MARRYHFVNGHPERFHIITFEGAFHGRTLAGIAAGGKEKYLEGFGPKVQGFDQVPPDDLKALEAGDHAGRPPRIMIEPIQGEGGVASHAAGIPARACASSATSTGLLLIFDEIQTGVGRTGKLFAYEWAGHRRPTSCAIAKGIGGGFPAGRVPCHGRSRQGHDGRARTASTYGGNPLAMAVGNAAIDLVLAPGFPAIM